MAPAILVGDPRRPDRTLISTAKGGANLKWAIEGTPGTTWRSGKYYDQRKLATKVNPQQNNDTLVDVAG